MWNLEKNSTDEPIFKAEVETQTQRTNVQIYTKGGKQGWGINWEIRIYTHTHTHTHTHTTVYKIDT